MARKHHKSKSGPSRKRPSSASEQPPQTRDEIIENERIRLMRAHSLLSCITRAMENDGVCAGEGPYWPAAIEAVCELIDEAIGKLEDLERTAIDDSGRSIGEVREASAVYEVRPLH